MNRPGLIAALVIAVIAGVAFGLFPQLDLAVASYFHGYVDNRHYFAFRIYPPLMWMRDVGLWVQAMLVAPAVAALVTKLLLPRWRMIVSARAAVFLSVSLALGPGLLVNAGLKDHWGRPRPIDIQQLGGDQHFMTWWDPRGECRSNCSFVSGDVSGAFWTLAPAALAPPQWRALAYGAALAFGTGMGAIRVMAGGHFVSDAIFAGVFTFLIVWLMHALIYRWPRTRLSDQDIECALERIALPGADIIAGLFGGRRKPER